MNERDPREGASDGFHEVIALHDRQDLHWEELQSMAPTLPRGWFELSRFSVQDRIEFTREFWYSMLCPSEALQKQLDHFFTSMEEIGVFATQAQSGQPFDVHMVYSLKGAKGFFQGSPPAKEESLANLAKLFGNEVLPPAYLGFLKIHDGFSKYMDTGLIKSRDMPKIYQLFQRKFKQFYLTGPDEEIITASSLIPFYESTHLHHYQCFYIDWFPEDEMGNILFSEDNDLEGMVAFPTFLSWLIFYLQDVTV